MRSSNLLTLIYLAIGIFVASDHNYFKKLENLDQIVSAILAVILWPLVLFDVNLHVNFGALILA